jgi:hypothetical protein
MTIDNGTLVLVYRLGDVTADLALRDGLHERSRRTSLTQRTRIRRPGRKRSDTGNRSETSPNDGPGWRRQSRGPRCTCGVAGGSRAGGRYRSPRHSPFHPSGLGIPNWGDVAHRGPAH